MTSSNINNKIIFTYLLSRESLLSLINLVSVRPCSISLSAKLLMELTRASSTVTPCMLHVHERKEYSRSCILYIDSAPRPRSLLFFVVDSVCLSVCLSRCSFKLLLFCFSMELSHFWQSVLHVALYKTVFFDF